MDEARIEEPVQRVERDEIGVESHERDSYLDSDLERSDGAMATMNIDSSAEMGTSDEDINMQEEAKVQIEPSPGPAELMPSMLDESAEQGMFFVDTVGDPSLATRNTTEGHAAAKSARASSPADSASSDEVIIFRGRKDHVTSHEDPIPLPLEPAATLSMDQPKLESNAESHITDALMAALADRQSFPLDTAGEPTSEEATGWGNKPPRMRNGIVKRWMHADGVEDTAPDFPDSRDEPVASNTSRRGKGPRKRQNRQMQKLKDDLEDEIMRDYLENISDPENLTAPKHTLGGTDDEWESSVMDDADDRGAEDQDGDLTGFTIDDDSSEASPVSSDVESEDSEYEEGDDSDLESDLENNERQKWEDDEDLRQRQRDAMTDEEIARILATQESMGITGDDLCIFDDSGFGDLDEARAGLEALSSMGGRNRNGMRRSNRGRQSDRFPDASLMADILEQDPYGGFDVMEWDRPSLKRKSKGRKSAGALPEEIADLSDEDLISELQSSWAADRSKKAAKKAEREELRALGMLGSGRKKGKVDMNQRYSWGMDMSQVKEELEEFIEGRQNDKAFPPMAKSERKILHEIANQFNLKSTSRGSGKNRFTVFTKTSRTIGWSDARWEPIVARARKGFLPNAKQRGKKNDFERKRAGRGGGFDKNAVGYRHGEVVGGTAPEIAQGNFGRKLMERMGWSQGMALGKDDEDGAAVPGRLLVPVQAKIKSGRGGLG